MYRANFTAVLFVLVYGVALAFGQPEYPTAKDVSVKAEVPTPRETAGLEVIKKMAARQSTAAFSPKRLISPTMPIAIRQEHPDGPTYQEGRTYTFLIHSMKFAGVVRRDDGRLILVGTGWLSNPSRLEPSIFVIHSDDEGRTWSPPNVIHKGLERPEPIYLGGQNLVMIPRDDPGFISMSEDGGETWGEKTSFPPFPDGRVSYRNGSVLVEGNTLTGVFYAEGPAHGPVGWTAHSVIRRSRDGGRTWDEGIWLPPQWQTSEGAVARAKDGALVVSLRTAQPEGYPSYSDHWRRITTARSTDEGKTWSHHQVHFRYGKVHSRLLTLKNGDILMTYAARMGELDGQIYHGIEAVLSRDHGKTWDWDHRFILFRWAMHQSTHTPVSIELPDGRILTLFLYHYNASWGEGSLGNPGYPLGITSIVFWTPYPEGQ